MKVLQDNYTNSNVIETVKLVNPYPRKTFCDNCCSELEYEESDLHMGYLGCMHLTCPLCNNENMIEENENTITLTKDNVEFPTHFWHTSKENGAVDCLNNEDVKRAIGNAINYFRCHKDEYHWFTAYGNLRVDVIRYDGDESYEVAVTGNYYEVSIPFEDDDY